MSGSEEKEFLHLASSQDAAEVVAKTLAELGRDERVIGMGDFLACGPLHDVDEGGAARIAWWSRIQGEPLTPDEARAYDDSEVWAGIRGTTTQVMLWHGRHPSERLFVLRACWHLRDEPARVNEVALPPFLSPVLAEFWGSVECAKLKQTVRAWATRKKVNDVAERAESWETIRGKTGDWLRVLEGDEIVHLPLTAHDDELVTACLGDWTNSIRVVAKKLADIPTGDAFLCWRMKELVREGKLEGRGEMNRLGLPNEVRGCP